MINYYEKGYGLHLLIDSSGYNLSQVDGVWVSDNDVAVQAIIDNYDPLPDARLSAIENVNTAVDALRKRYATDIAFQEKAYTDKLADCQAFKDAGYPEASILSYPYVYARASRLNVTGQVAADFIINLAAQWDDLLIFSENARDAANDAINAATDWTQCSVIADALVAQMDAI